MNKAQRIAGVAALLLLSFLAGGIAEQVWDFPYGWAARHGVGVGRPPLPGQSAYVPWYSNAQGGEDAPRAEVRAGRRIDMARCITTLTMRNETRAEATDVCNKIVTGLGE